MPKTTTAKNYLVLQIPQAFTGRKNPEARKVWEKISKLQLDFLPGYEFNLESACYHYSQYMHHRAISESAGDMGEDGKPHPSFNLASKHLAIFGQQMQAMGLTASTLARIGSTKKIKAAQSHTDVTDSDFAEDLE